ncbi:organic cation transporter protein-like isoform X1 [Antedon mediterranea]|uniref:organic cation transporter protein-like isoform X1 n=1 Tax=Antedon mediterranea TaxID=105859 RepID=UPI003AF82721
MSKMDIDEILRSLKPWGRYQILLLLVVCVYGTMVPALHIIAFIFIVDTPTHFCKPYEGFSKSEAIPISKEHSDTIVEYESCLIYEIDNGTLTNETIGCPNGNEYMLTVGESTVVNEFDLVCDKKLMANTVVSVYFCGVLVGSIVSGLTSDYFGRRNVFLAATFLIGITGIALTFTTSFYSFAAVWFFTAIIEQCINVPSFVLLMEMFPPEKRTAAGCLSNVSWGVAIAFLPLYAYLLRDWRHMQIAISAPCLTAVFLWWFVYESPRWMISKGRLTDANNVFRKIAKFNKLDESNVYIDAIPKDFNIKTNLEREESNESMSLQKRNDVTGSAKSDVAKERTYTMIDVFRRPRMLRNTLITYCIFMINSLVYYGMALNSSNLYGDKYLNMFLVCLVDLPGGIITVYLLPRYNRRLLLSVFLIAASLFSFISGFTPLTSSDGTNLFPIILTSACLGKCAIVAAFGTGWLYGNEIFPTELRNTGFGTCSFAARIGSIIAPFFLTLNSHYDGGVEILFGVLAAMACLAVYILPETRNRPLPETMEEGENLHAGKIKATNGEMYTQSKL